MTATVASAAHLQCQLEPARETLRESFGCEFAFWAKIKGDWLAVDAAVATDEGWQCELLLAFGERREPMVVAAEGTALKLALPLKARTTPVVAMAILPTGDPDQVSRFGRLAVRECDLRHQVKRLGNENEAFLRQVTNDFEELVFLRNMADVLEISDFSFDLGAMAEKILPTLQPLCEAEAMVVVEATERNGEAGPDSRRGGQWWFGNRCADEDACARLVEQFREASLVQPVVKNHFDEMVEGESFDGISSFVMVPIVNANDVIGWMLALNRNHDRNLWLEEEGWEISYLEFGTHEATLMGSTAAILATHARNIELFKEREGLLVSVVRALVSAIEAKDEYTRGHSERVALYGKRLAVELGMDEDYCERLYLTGLLHDVGKIGIRDAVLRKPGPLTDDEFAEIKQHPDHGWDILHDLEPLRYVLPGVLHHHEQLDGKGYPDKLAGDDIPQDGRILAVADAYDAMTSDRPYRPGMPHEKAAKILKGGSGSQWDAKMIDAFFRAMPDILRIKETYEPRVTEKRSKPSKRLLDTFVLLNPRSAASCRSRPASRGGSCIRTEDC